MTPRRINGIWAALLAATAITWALGDSGLIEPGRHGWAVPLILALAGVKGALVVLDYMELREAPVLWRRLLLGWLGGVSAVILLAWALG